MDALAAFTGRYMYRSDFGLLDTHHPLLGLQHVAALTAAPGGDGAAGAAVTPPSSMAFSANAMTMVQERMQQDAEPSTRVRQLLKGDHIAFWFSTSPQTPQLAGASIVYVGRRDTVSPLWLAKLPAGAAASAGASTHSNKKQRTVAGGVTPSRASSGGIGRNEDDGMGRDAAEAPRALVLPNAYSVCIVDSRGRFLVACCTPLQQSSSSRGAWPTEDAVPVHSLQDDVVVAMAVHEQAEAGVAAESAGRPVTVVLLTAADLLFVTVCTDPSIATGGSGTTSALCAASVTVVRCPLPGAAAGHKTMSHGTPCTRSTCAVTVASFGGSDVFVTRFDAETQATTGKVQRVSSFPFAASCGLITGPYGTVGLVEALPTAAAALDDGASSPRCQRIGFVTLIAPEADAAAQEQGNKKASAKQRGVDRTNDAFEVVALPPVSLPPSARFVASCDLSSAPGGKVAPQRRAASKSSLVLVIEKQSHRLESVQLDLKLQGLPSQAEFDALPWTSCGPQQPDGDVDDVAMLSDAPTTSSPSFVYPLPLSSQVVLFRITAPFSVHSKLATQWVVGPKVLAEAFQQPARSCGSGAASKQHHNVNSLPLWAQHRYHPTHVRAALRRLAPADLLAVFCAACACARRGMLDEGTTTQAQYTSQHALAMSNGCAVAMHIVTMHRQVGITLPAEAVSDLFGVLRACRAAGHVSGRAAQRLKSMLSFHDDAASSHNRTRATASFGSTDPSWRRGRLHVRYCPSEFAEHIATSMAPGTSAPSAPSSSVLAAVAGTKALLDTLNNRSSPDAGGSARGNALLRPRGGAVHTDDVLHQYESAFLINAAVAS